MAIDLNIVIGGAAGQGVHTITGLLAKILVRQGCQVLFVQDYQSRIRGGHLFNRIRVLRSTFTILPGGHRSPGGPEPGNRPEAPGRAFPGRGDYLRRRRGERIAGGIKHPGADGR